MLVLQNNKMRLRFGIAAILVSIALPASALIIVDANAARQSSYGIQSRLGQGNYSANYLVNRSHAWRQYQYGRQQTGNQLVIAPFRGGVVSSLRQSSAGSLVARAHAYRLGERW